MFRLQYSNGAPHRITVPYRNQKRELLRLAQAFVTQENSLLPEERTRYTANIEAMLNVALAARNASAAEEANRKAASETLKRLDATACTTVGQIRSLLEGRFKHNPEQAQQWGFFVRQSGHGAGNILTPRGRDDIMVCLEAYIATEEARLAAERFTEPPLADVVTLHDALAQQLVQRNQSRQERLSHNSRLDEACASLAKELRLALADLVLKNFDGEAERDLGRWGFDVVARSPRRLPTEVAPPLPEEETIELPELA